MSSSSLFHACAFCSPHLHLFFISYTYQHMTTELCASALYSNNHPVVSRNVHLQNITASLPSNMTRDNQVVISAPAGQYKCIPCDREFNSYNGLSNHCEKAAVHSYGDQWCNRCDWLFVSETARRAHIESSSHHHLCPVADCNCDFVEASGLVEHIVAVHYFCIECKTYFADDNSLTQV